MESPRPFQLREPLTQYPHQHLDTQRRGIPIGLRDFDSGYLYQRQLAEQTGKSQSWIRDIEKGRFSPKVADKMLQQRVLGLI